MPALGRESERERGGEGGRDGGRDGGTEGGAEGGFAHAFWWIVDPCVARLHELAGGLVAARRRLGACQHLGGRERERERERDVR